MAIRRGKQKKTESTAKKILYSHTFKFVISLKSQKKSEYGSTSNVSLELYSPHFEYANKFGTVPLGCNFKVFPLILMSLFLRPAYKVIDPKYSKHWLSTVAHTIDCVCSKISYHGLNHG